MNSSSLPDHVDVLVIGMGPVGAALACLLGRQGVRALVVDRNADIFMAPRAIALDHEALRILQACGLEDGELPTLAIPEVRMLSPLFGRYGRAVTAGAVDGHPRLVTFYQPDLERLLRTHAERHPHVRLAYGVEALAIAPGDDGVQARLRDAEGRESSVRARYLVGADGASSFVRRALGIGFQGRTYTEDWLVVDVRRAPEPIGHVAFHCDPARPTPHMPAPGDRQRWEFKLAPGEQREEMERPETVRRLLEPWMQGREPDIERVAVYRFHARVVDRFGKGRTFLVGDAAHITPPFIGQGLVAGLRDVSNLAWKLAHACRCPEAPAEVLDSYDTERRPHARSMVRLATWMGRLVMPRNAVAAFLTHGLMASLTRVPRLRRLFEDLEMKPPHEFRRGLFLGRGRHDRLRRGGLFPQVWARERPGIVPRLTDEWLGHGFAVVGFGVDPWASALPAVRAVWQRQGARFLQVAPRGGLDAAVGEHPAPPVRTQVDAPTVVIEDLAGALMPYRVPVGWVAVVRPDRIVMAEGPTATLDRLLVQCASRLGLEAPGHRSAIPVAEAVSRA